MPISSSWQHDPTDDAYTLISDDVRCRVWRTLSTWQAIVSRRGDATAAYNFKTVQDACAWCERLMAERKAGK